MEFLRMFVWFLAFLMFHFGIALSYKNNCDCNSAVNVLSNKLVSRMEKLVSMLYKSRHITSSNTDIDGDRLIALENKVNLMKSKMNIKDVSERTYSERLLDKAIRSEKIQTPLTEMIAEKEYKTMNQSITILETSLEDSLAAFVNNISSKIANDKEEFTTKLLVLERKVNSINVSVTYLDAVTKELSETNIVTIENSTKDMSNYITQLIEKIHSLGKINKCDCSSTMAVSSSMVMSRMKRIESILHRAKHITSSHGDPGNSCDDLRKGGIHSGVLNVSLRESGRKIPIYCDMETDGGGWTVFQRRYDGSVNFTRNFDDYVNGFGSVYGEFWLGLENIRKMVAKGTFELRLDLLAADGVRAYEVYRHFKVRSSPGYKLRIGKGKGIAGSNPGLRYNSGKNFTTFDSDNNRCAVLDRGGWWYDDCTYANLNGEYTSPGTVSVHHSGEGGMTYREFQGVQALKETKMMFRKCIYYDL